VLLIVLCNMAGYLSDFDDVDDNFEYEGRHALVAGVIIRRMMHKNLYITFCTFSYEPFHENMLIQ